MTNPLISNELGAILRAYLTSSIDRKNRYAASTNTSTPTQTAITISARALICRLQQTRQHRHHEAKLSTAAYPSPLVITTSTPRACSAFPASFAPDFIWFEIVSIASDALSLEQRTQSDPSSLHWYALECAEIYTQIGKSLIVTHAELHTFYLSAYTTTRNCFDIKSWSRSVWPAQARWNKKC